jgi:signal transduction histidine kinase
VSGGAGRLRSRLALRAALPAAAALAAVCIVVDIALVRPMAGDAEDQLRTRLDGLAAVVAEGGEAGFRRRANEGLRAGRSEFAALRVPGGHVLADVGRPVSGGEAGAAVGAVREVEDPVAGPFLVLAKAVRGPAGEALEVAAGVSVQDLRDRQSALRAIVLVAAAGGILLVGAGAWFGASLVLDPLRGLTSAAGGMGSDPTGRRLPVRDPGDEIDDLARLLNDLLARIEGSLEEERRFAGDAAHELRSPLSVLRLRAEQALGAGDPAAMRAALEGVLADADRVHRLVQALLELSRAAGPGAAGEKGGAAVDAGAVLVELTGDLRTLAETRGLALDCAPPPRTARTAAPREVLETAVSVLVDNAFRYTPSGGRVAVEAIIEGATLRVRVRDTGPGVPDDEAAKVFDRLYRGRAGRASKAGFGLGLPLARRLARSVGGEVLLENPGQPGACFTLLLPAA